METNLMPLIMLVPKAIQEAPVRSWTWMITDESGILEEIEITHFPDGREIDVQPILSIINNILNDCAINPSLEDSKDDEEEFVDEVVQHEIHTLSPKLAYMSSENGDVHEKTIDVFKMLSNYPWEAKLTLALAALVTNYGEYWVISQSNSKGELTKMMKFLRQMGENIPAHQSRFDVLHDLMESLSDMIKGILKIKEFMLSAEDETTISIATTIIVIASYWTVRSIVISAPYIHSLFAEDYEPSAPKERELVIMTRKIRALLECLQNHQETSDEKVQHALHETDVAYNMEQKYQEMLRAFDEEDHGDDNTWILNFLFNSKGNNDLAPIVDCSTNQMVELESLKNKTVMLMISSGIDNISKQMLQNLAQIWNDYKLHNWESHDEYKMVWSPTIDEYKMIWFPIIEQSMEWDDSMQNKFEELRSEMPFYSTNDPRRIDPTVAKFVKEKLGFKKETILVVMNRSGKILHHNAIHMLWIWGVSAFHLTQEREAFLWRDYVWRITDLFRGIDERIIELIDSTEKVWVIGGDNMELIKRLESNINSIDQTCQNSSTIMYTGKNSKSNNIRSKWEMSGNKELRHSWEDDDDKKWLFWTRVKTMFLSRIQFLRNSSSGKVDDDDDDEVVKTLTKLLSYDNNSQTWVMYNDKSSPKMSESLIVKIEDLLVMLDVLPVESVLPQNDATNLFIKALRERYEQVRTNTIGPSHEYGCSRVEFHTETTPPKSIKCPECSKSMEMCIALLCCHHNQQP